MAPQGPEICKEERDDVRLQGDSLLDEKMHTQMSIPTTVLTDFHIQLYRLPFLLKPGLEGSIPVVFLRPFDPHSKNHWRCLRLAPASSFIARM